MIECNFWCWCAGRLISSDFRRSIPSSLYDHYFIHSFVQFLFRLLGWALDFYVAAFGAGLLLPASVDAAFPFDEPFFGSVFMVGMGTDATAAV